MHILAEVGSGLDGKMLFWLIAGSVAIVAIISTALTTILVQRGKERTRREIAAYLAEGSIDKDTALAMFRSGSAEEEEEA